MVPWIGAWSSCSAQAAGLRFSTSPAINQLHAQPVTSSKREGTPKDFPLPTSLLEKKKKKNPGSAGFAGSKSRICGGAEGGAPAFLPQVPVPGLEKPDPAGVTAGVPGRAPPPRGRAPGIPVPAPLRPLLARRREAMAAVFLPGNLQDEATCSVCLEFFKDPVSIECGHNFCRACIVKSWQELEMDFPCPQCREVFQQKSFRPNRQLANMSEIISQFALRGAKGAEGDGLCPKHREALKLYCKDDRRAICVVCDRSREHRPHAVVPVDEASEEYKVRPSVPTAAFCPRGARPALPGSPKRFGRGSQTPKNPGERVLCGCAHPLPRSPGFPSPGGEGGRAPRLPGGWESFQRRARSIKAGLSFACARSPWEQRGILWGGVLVVLGAEPEGFPGQRIPCFPPSSSRPTKSKSRRQREGKQRPQQPLLLFPGENPGALGFPEEGAAGAAGVQSERR